VAQVGELVERARAAGLPVELEVDGDPAELSPDADLAAFRAVQEALTNVLKHAGAVPTTVRVRWSGDALGLTVENEGGRAQRIGGASRGLEGMRERLGECGGELDAGPRPGGGFRVDVRLPAAEVVA
jgi:signal transduction histidine kinase